MRKLLKLIVRSLAKHTTPRRQEADDETQHNLLDLSEYGTPVKAPRSQPQFIATPSEAYEHHSIRRRSPWISKPTSRSTPARHKRRRRVKDNERSSRLADRRHRILDGQFQRRVRRTAGGCHQQLCLAGFRAALAGRDWRRRQPRHPRPLPLPTRPWCRPQRSTQRRQISPAA